MPRPKRRLPVWPLALAGACLFFGLAALAAVLLWPSKGTLIVESDDPDAEVIVKRNGEVVRDRTKDRELTLRSGPYTVELAGAKPGFKLAPEQVEIPRRGGARVRVQGPPAPPPPPPANAPTPDRRAAEYVLSLGGIVRLNGSAKDVK